MIIQKKHCLKVSIDDDMIYVSILVDTDGEILSTNKISELDDADKKRMLCDSLRKGRYKYNSKTSILTIYVADTKTKFKMHYDDDEEDILPTYIKALKIMAQN
jgi:hypothetical protein